MIVFPNCKINLGLTILRKRSDGYHDLETIFYPLQLTDAVEVIASNSTAKPALPFVSTGLPIAGIPTSNLCIKAYKLLRKDFPGIPGVQIHLHKVIPTGAGIGGGSADAAFTLKMVNKLFNLGITTEQLIEYGLQLGSDCPFFIINKPCFASGRGELLEEIELNLSDYKFVIVNPGIHIDTGGAFRDITPALPSLSVKEIIRNPVETWKDNLINDFEKTIFQKYPEIGVIKDSLYNIGAVYAAMSGSGSTVFGIFPKEMNLQLSFPANYFVKEIPT